MYDYINFCVKRKKNTFCPNSYFVQAQVSVLMSTESQQAQSKPDFVSKISIALKEASETKYWIKLLGATEYLSENQTKSILDDCVEIEKILVTILKSAKNQ